MILKSFWRFILLPPGDQYYTYEFLHQPSHEECITMSETTPSMLFKVYNNMYYNNYEPFLSDLFSECECFFCRLFVFICGRAGKF